MSKFELKETPKGHWHFVLKADNGETIAQSETYTSKAAAENGIESVRVNAPGAEVVYEDYSEPEPTPSLGKPAPEREDWTNPTSDDYEEDHANMPTPFVVEGGE